MTDTIELPREQFLRHLLPLLVEGGVRWHCSDEVEEQIDYADLADPSNVQTVDVDEDAIRVYSELQATENERVRRATRWQPAEYRNHDITVHVTFQMSWPEDAYSLPNSTVVDVDQEGGRSTPPDPEPYEV